MTVEELLESPITVSTHSDDLAVTMARAVTRRRMVTRRRGWVAGIITAAVLLASAGGLSTAAANGVWPFRWVDGPDTAGTHLVTVASGDRFSCPFELHVNADYSSSGTYAQIRKGELEARRYIQSIDVNQIKPNPKLMPPQSDTDAEPNTPQYWLTAWTAAIQQKVELHMRAVGMPAPSLEGQWGKCTPTGGQ